MEQLERITQDPAVMGGMPRIRGMRVTVGMIVGQIGAGRTLEEILADYPYLDREDILQARVLPPGYALAYIRLIAAHPKLVAKEVA